MTIYAFAKESSISQQTLSSWKQRDRSIASLPIQLLGELSYFSGLSLSDIRDKFMIYELEDLESKLFPLKEGTRMIDKEKETKFNLFKEAGEKFGLALCMELTLV